MRRLGVDTTVSATASMFDVIRNLASQSPVLSVGNLASCSARIMEFRVTDNSNLVGRTARTIGLPPGCRIIGIVRGGEALSPTDSIVIQTGDTLLGYVPHAQENAVRSLLLENQ